MSTGSLRRRTGRAPENQARTCRQRPPVEPTGFCPQPALESGFQVGSTGFGTTIYALPSACICTCAASAMAPIPLSSLGFTPANQPQDVSCRTSVQSTPAMASILGSCAMSFGRAQVRIWLGRRIDMLTQVRGLNRWPVWRLCVPLASLPVVKRYQVSASPTALAGRWRCRAGRGAPYRAAQAALIPLQGGSPAVFGVVASDLRLLSLPAAIIPPLCDQARLRARRSSRWPLPGGARGTVHLQVIAQAGFRRPGGPND